MKHGRSLTLRGYDLTIVVLLGDSEMRIEAVNPMDKKRLDYYKKKLQSKREDLVKSIARTEEEGRAADDDPTVDLADKAANSYTKEFLFGQNNTDRNTLQLLDEALERIKNGTYGVCAQCETELQQKRLEAVPWARNCTSCQEKHEQGIL